MLRVSLLGLLGLQLVGCAHQSFKATFVPNGDASNLRHFTELNERAANLPVGEGKDVRVLLDRLPEGMTVKEGELTYDHDRYTVVAQLRIEPGPNYIGIWFADYDEHERWKNVYCNAQVPLNWVTLYMWVVLPFYWPCFQGSLDENERLEHMVARLQSAATLVGGNLVVATAGSTSYINRQTQQVVSTANTTHLVGFVLKDAGPSKQQQQQAPSVSTDAAPAPLARLTP